MIDLLRSRFWRERRAATATAGRVRIFELESASDQVPRVIENRTFQKGCRLLIADDADSIDFDLKVVGSLSDIQFHNVLEAAAATALHAEAKKSVGTAVFREQSPDLSDGDRGKGDWEHGYNLWAMRGADEKRVTFDADSLRR